MSGSNALAAAKRRRTGGQDPNKPIPRGGVQTQPQRGNVLQGNQRIVGRPPMQAPSSAPTKLPQYQNNQVRPPSRQSTFTPPPQNVKMDLNNKITDSIDEKTREFSELPESSRFFMIPPLTDKPINHLQLLVIVHRYFNKLAYHLPNAVDMLGTNFNLISSNCDNLNDRLEALENSLPEITQGKSSTDQESERDSSQETKNEFVNIRNEISIMKSEFNKTNDQFRSEIENVRQEVSSSVESLRAELVEIRNLLTHEGDETQLEDEEDAEETHVRNEELEAVSVDDIVTEDA